MELRHLRYFVAVVEEGSLTTAAELRLHTSQPSLSRQIRDLEYQVGAELLSRSVHGVELTAAGKAFLDHARLALAQVDAAVEAAKEHPCHDLERLFAGPRRGARPRPARRGLPARRAGLRPVLRGGGPRAADRPDAERPSPDNPRSDSPARIRRRDLHRRGEQSLRATGGDRRLSAPLWTRHQTGSRGGQYGYGHVSGFVHPRVGAYARLCEESAAVVRGQPPAGGRGANNRC